MNTNFISLGVKILSSTGGTSSKMNFHNHLPPYPQEIWHFKQANIELNLSKGQLLTLV